MVVDLSYAEIGNIILEIILGERISTIKYSTDLIIFTQPSGNLKLYLNYLEKQHLNNYLDQGYISEDIVDKDQNLKDSFFSLEEQKDLEEIQKKIKGYHQILKKRDKKSKVYQEDLAKIEILKNQEKELLNKKSTINLFTAEYKAREERFIDQFLSCSLDLTTRNKIFSKLDDIDSTIYTIDMLNQDLGSYLDFYFGYDTEIIRKIARSDQWWSYLASCDKDYLTLFNRDASSLTVDQLNLISWSRYYLNIKEMPYKDRPNEELIDDDIKLDSYLEEFTRKLQAELSLSKKESVGNKDHVIVTADSPDYIKYHKDNIYSDTSLITGKTKEDTTKYDESEQFKKIKERNK